jgi:hypothetical protein
VIIPIHGLDRVAMKAIQFAMHLSDELIAVFIDTGSKDVNRLKKLWAEKIEAPAKLAKITAPRLEIVPSPYRRIYKPMLRFVRQIKIQKPERLFAIVIPELVEPYWYEHLLHNVRATGLRTLFFLERDQRTVVITIPWYLSDKK